MTDGGRRHPDKKYVKGVFKRFKGAILLIIRRFLRGVDDSAWAELAQINLGEFKASMLDPEFSDLGMYVAEIKRKAEGIANAHISPSHPRFCVLRSFNVKSGYWDMVASPLLDVVLKSLAERNAEAVETRVPEDATRHISLFERKGFKVKYIECKMKHDLKHLPLKKILTVQFKTYSEVGNPELIENLQNEIFKGITGRPVTKEEIVYWMENLDFECFMGYCKRNPVASSFCEIRSMNNEKQGWIYGLGVLPSYQRKKIGTALVYKVLNFIKSKGAKYAFVETDYEGYQQRFYESVGFRVESKALWLQKLIGK